MSGSCDVIIPCKDAPQWLALCLEELFRNAAANELGKTLVIDDGSSPDSFAAIERICARYPGVRLLKNEGQTGFGGACNFGVSHSSAPCLLFLETDCLVTPGAVHKLVVACEADTAIGLACPLSNNSSRLSLPLLPGRSYIEMNTLLEQATANTPPKDVALDAVAVANCLFITRRCWEKTGGFSEVSGSGCVDVSDYQLRAIDNGFRGVALINTFVFHFGSASSPVEPNAKSPGEMHGALLLEKWGDKYRALIAKQQSCDPATMASRRLAALPSTTLRPAVLFVLPGLQQGVGGIHVVVDICNYLIRHGLDAKCAVLGHFDEKSLSGFQEPMFFNFLHFPYEQAFVAQSTVSPKCVVATLFSTAPGCSAYATFNRIPLIYFVQGYECLFENGTVYNQAADTYALADHLIVTSEWLKTKVLAHAAKQTLNVLPLGIDLDLFRPRKRTEPKREKVRVGLVLRDAQDKGQWILLDVIDALAAHKDTIDLTVLTARKYELPRKWSKQEYTRVELPLDRPSIAEHVGVLDIFVDASLHEGFGLFPLEAMACGAVPIVSDSGGVNQYVRSGENGIVIAEINRPEKYVAAILALAQNKTQLESLKIGAQKTATGYAAETMFCEYDAFLRKIIKVPREADVRLEAIVHTFFQRGPNKEVQLSELIIEKEKRINELAESLTKITSGASYRLGRFVTAPLRMLFKRF
jgi:GT2 family glycosyltransferase/glycosyltransferase involved in cell wall biosynthesis